MRTVLLCFFLVSSGAMANAAYDIMIEAIRDNDLEWLEAIASDEDLMARASIEPWTPLHEAAWLNKAGAAEILLNHGADINARDGNGWTPLHVSVRKGWFEISHFLIINKASGYVKDCEEKTPVEYVQPANPLFLTVVLQSLLNKAADES